MNQLTRRRITDQEILNAKVPDDTLLTVSEGGQQREITFQVLMEEKAERINSTDYCLLSASLCYYGSGGYDGWVAKVKSGPLLP